MATRRSIPKHLLDAAMAPAADPVITIQGSSGLSPATEKAITEVAKAVTVAIDAGATHIEWKTAPDPRMRPHAGFIYKSRPVFKPSPQQADFFREVREGRGNLILRAVAGAGKTTTLIEGLRFMGGAVFFGAYNKAIVKEIQTKAEDAKVIRQGIFIKTFHAAGMRAFCNLHKTTRVDDRKTLDLARDYIKEKVSHQFLDQCMPFVTKMISFGKQFLLGVVTDLHSHSEWLKLIEHFSMDQELPEHIPVTEVLPHVIELYIRSHRKCPEVIDFDDMLYAPLAYGCRFDTHKWVLIDEAQDANLARRIMAKKMLAPGGRVIAVGDEFQAIYGFTGAGGDSLQKIQEMFNCKVMPLTVTYRCARKIVEYAHQWVDHIQAMEGAPEGIVREALIDPKSPKTPWFMLEKPIPTDAVICRYTKPLVACAYGMLREGIACKIEGRDLGKNLIKLATRWKISRIDTLNARLDDYQSNEVRKAQLAKNSKREAEAIDQVATLRIFIERCKAKGLNDIEQLCYEIEMLFEDNVAGAVKLCTGHKAKGREWDKVYWLQSANRMRPGQPWQEQEELNLKYVIATRAKLELVLVPEKEKDFG